MDKHITFGPDGAFILPARIADQDESLEAFWTVEENLGYEEVTIRRQSKGVSDAFLHWVLRQLIAQEPAFKLLGAPTGGCPVSEPAGAAQTFGDPGPAGGDAAPLSAPQEAPKRGRKKKEEPTTVEPVVVPPGGFTQPTGPAEVGPAAFTQQMAAIEAQQRAEMAGAPPAATPETRVESDDPQLMELPSGRTTSLKKIYELLTDPPLLTGPLDGDLLSTVNPQTRQYPDTVLTRILYLAPVAVAQREHPEPAKYVAKLPPAAEALLPLATLDTQGVEDFLAVLNALQANFAPIPIIDMNLGRGEAALRGRVQAKFTEIAGRVRAAAQAAAQKAAAQ